MDIGNSLRRLWRDDITIRSIIANTIHEIYNHECEVQSVKVHGNTILIKTGSPLINAELQLLDWKIKQSALKKLWWVWIKLSANIKFRFQ